MNGIVRVLSAGAAVTVLVYGPGSPAEARQVGIVPKAIVGAPVFSSMHRNTCSRCPVENRLDAVFGGGAEGKFGDRYSAEIDAIYKPRKYQVQDHEVVSGLFTPTPFLFIPTHTKEHTFDTEGHSWEFPAIVKRSWSTSGRTTPYALAGLVVSRTTGTTIHTEIDTILQSYLSSTTSESLTQAGIVLGGGMALKFGRLRLYPEGRYTEWLRPDLPGRVRVSRGVDLVLGISIGK